jgi:hypothetical protein
VPAEAPTNSAQFGGRNVAKAAGLPYKLVPQSRSAAMATRKISDTSTGRKKADRSPRTGKAQGQGMLLLSPQQQETERQQRRALEEKQLLGKQASGLSLTTSEERRLKLLQRIKGHYSRFDAVRGVPATKGDIPNAEDAPDSLLNAAELMWTSAVLLIGDNDSEALRFCDQAIAQLKMALAAVEAGATTRRTAAQISQFEMRVRSGRERLIAATIISLEDTSPGGASLETTGISGMKDEGLVQEPQRKIADAGIEIVARPERRLNPRQLSAFMAHAAANPWDSNSGVAPSAHIKTTFKKWLGRGLWREHIVKAQPNLAGAYAAEVSRDPSKRVEGLVVRVHKLPPGAKRALSMRLVAEMSEEERELKRAIDRERKQRQRQKAAGLDR